jgi:uncharacterized membrane protein (DUF373 family)
MTFQHHHSESTGMRNRRHLVRSVLEFVQDLIVVGLCVGIFAAMVIKLLHLGRELMGGTDFSQVLANIMFILVLMELFRLLLIYLEEHRVSISTMVEVGIVAAIREALLMGALHVNWLQLLVLCAFILTLGLVLRYAGIRTLQSGASD